MRRPCRCWGPRGRRAPRIVRVPARSVPDRDGHLLVLLHAGHRLALADRRLVEREQVAVLVLVGEGTELERVVGGIVPRARPLDTGDVAQLALAVALEEIGRASCRERGERSV